MGNIEPVLDDDPKPVCVLQKDTDGVPAGHFVQFWKNAHGEIRVLRDMGMELSIRAMSPIPWGGRGIPRGVSLLWEERDGVYGIDLRTKRRSYRKGDYQLRTVQTESGRWLLVVIG